MPNQPPRARATDPLSMDPAGEPLTFHGPGWTIRTGDYEVICWAPGQVVQQGHPTGELRTEWLLSVELPPAPAGARPDTRSCRSWESGGFLAGTSLDAVLPALALLSASDRQHVTDVLTAQLAEGEEASS